jgi:HEAT repeat protein
LSVVVALEAIGNLGDVEATDEVLAIAASTADPLVLEEAIATLASLGDPRGLPVVLAASAGKPALRRRSVAALGAFEGAEVEAALDRLGDDRDWQVRQAVAMLRREELDEVPPDDDDA